MQTACRIQHVPIVCFIPNLFVCVCVRYIFPLSLRFDHIFYSYGKWIRCIWQEQKEKIKIDRMEHVISYYFGTQKQKSHHFEMHKTKEWPMKRVQASRMMTQVQHGEKKMVVQFFCLMSLSFKWIETMREHLFCGLNKRKRRLIMIFILLCTLQCDKMTMKNGNEMNSIFIHSHETKTNERM